MRRKAARRHDPDKKSSTKETEGRVRGDRDRTSSRDRIMSDSIKKRLDSERTSDNSVTKEEKPKRDKKALVRRGHHPSVRRPIDSPSSANKKSVKDNTLSKHQRQYLTSEELASQSSASLLSVVKQENTYDPSDIKPISRRATCERKPKKKVPQDYPYNNYDSVSEKHLRREKKRLKYPKLTGFGDMGKGGKPPRHGSHKSKLRSHSAPGPGTNALVLRSESRRSSIGVSSIFSRGIIGWVLTYDMANILIFSSSPVLPVALNLEKFHCGAPPV